MMLEWYAFEHTLVKGSSSSLHLLLSITNLSLKIVQMGNFLICWIKKLTSNSIA